MRNTAVFGITAATLLFFSLFIFAYDTTIFLLQFVAYVVATCVVVTGLITTVFFCISIYERYRKIRAERIEAEKQANVMTVVSNGQVFIRETDHKAWWRAAHLDNRVYANSRETYDMPSREERDNWLLYNKPTPKLIEGQITGSVQNGDKPKTLYDLLNGYPHLMLIGSTNSGKTTQMSAAVEYRLKQYPNAKLVWLSTHAELDKNRIPRQAYVFSQPELIARALCDLFQAYRQRYQRDGNYSQIILAMDEWPEIIEELKDLGIEAGDYLRRMSRGARKTNFNLILASHGANVGDLGIAGHSTVKRDFAEVHLEVSLTKRNRAIWQQFDKKSSRVGIELPQVVITTDKQRQVIQMYESGYPVDQIALEVYGRGGRQLQLVQDTIAKYCVL